MSQENLVEYLINSGPLRSRYIINAFKSIDRADFILPEHDGEKYGDYPLPIGYGQTISQPTTVAFMLELLQPKQGDKILDVGSGSGWTTALLAQVVGKNSRVFGVEIVPELAKFSSKNLKKYEMPWVSIKQAGDAMGLSEQAPFDKILVSAAAEELPEELIKQLKVGGRMVIPVKNSVWQIDKVSADEIKKKEFSGFIFVPLR